MNKYEKNSYAKQFRFSVPSKFDKLNETMWKRFCQAGAKNTPISGPIIQQKAVYDAKERKIEDFKASSH